MSLNSQNGSGIGTSNLLHKNLLTDNQLIAMNYKNKQYYVLQSTVWFMYLCIRFSDQGVYRRGLRITNLNECTYYEFLIGITSPAHKRTDDR